MKNDVTTFLNKLGIEYRTINHPAVFTVSDIEKLDENVKPIKNLLLRENDGDKMFLIVAAGDARINMQLIREKFNSKRLCFANADTLMQTFRVTPGSVSIFCMMNSGASDVKVLIDETLMNDEELGFHPNENTSTVLFTSDNLCPVLDGMKCDYTIMKLY